MTDIPSFIWNILSGLPLIPSSKANAEVWLSRGELGLVIFGAVIIIGLVGEYWAERKKHRHEQSWIAPLRQKRWNWEFIFLLVVVLSIVGEFVSDADIWITSDVLQTIADSEIENLRSTNNKLEAQIAPRRLTLEQQKAISDSLAAFSGRRVKIESYAFDVEGRLLAKQISASFSPWIPVDDAIGALTPMGGSKLTEGISVTSDDMSFRDAITASLKTIGKLKADNEPPQFGAGSMVMARSNAQPTDALVFVGVKPLPE